ncbi:excalibur calcium-binding domain-containing protein [Xanthomonas sp. XNM01]|uniref:excalibur calcium-binding domain-containing protein n=1 Tax=Xanthomonas sp. XNM01 TaxID=2769289 RepID=UPI0031BB4CBF
MSSPFTAIDLPPAGAGAGGGERLRARTFRPHRCRRLPPRPGQRRPSLPRRQPRDGRTRAGSGERTRARAPAADAPCYRNCDAARAAGVAPLRRGEPGHAPHLDRDDDGIACEPSRRR